MIIFTDLYSLYLQLHRCKTRIIPVLPTSEYNCEDKKRQLKWTFSEIIFMRKEVRYKCKMLLSFSPYFITVHFIKHNIFQRKGKTITHLISPNRNIKCIPIQGWTEFSQWRSWVYSRQKEEYNKKAWSSKAWKTLSEFYVFWFGYINTAVSG